MGAAVEEDDGESEVIGEDTDEGVADEGAADEDAADEGAADEGAEEGVSELVCSLSEVVGIAEEAALADGREVVTEVEAAVLACAVRTRCVQYCARA